MIQALKKEHDILGKDIGLLLLRVAISAMMLTHGLPKLMNFGAIAGKFPDPLGVGSQTSLALAVFAEVFCAVLIIVGLVTRVAASQLVITMGVAAFIVNGGDFAKMELALVYLAGFLALLFAGAGRFSVDRLLFKRKAD